ncbi:hypothetical protein QLQ12_10880 [Actinoplanes sp. NEAU-A12]|uniref:WD40 repeat domain-containing protein n=1 Tax=Actinoplanes sandaracinus TaxID=3045177 RepID=A0ABT6WHB1_9ACTN|nr:hypothetical protein [Actinoplanes sandaracinus]MDI6099100.1 hypothetical protein [Actinoplanes sandaracinus]
MTRLEDMVGAAVRDLADSAPNAHDLASVARVRGRRIRRRRQALLGAAAVVLAGAVITPYAVLDGWNGGPRPQPVASVPPSTAPVVPVPSTVATAPAIRKDWWAAPVRLPGDLVVTSVGRREVNGPNGVTAVAPKTVQEGNVALDRSTGRYRAFSGGYQGFDGAPAGRYVMTDDGITAQIGILDSVTGQTRQLGHGSGRGVEWSADGKTLLLSLLRGGVRLIDAKTGAAVDREMPDAIALCPSYCNFTWLPGGEEIAIAQRDPRVERSEALPDTVRDIRVFSVATGKPLRTLPVPGVPAGSAAWSPDGRYVALLPDAAEEDGIRIAEVATGRIVATLPLVEQVRFIADDQILTVRGLDVGVYDLTGKLRQSSRLPQDFLGRGISLGRA